MDTPTTIGKSPQFTNRLFSMYPNGNTQLKFENGGFLFNQNYIFSFLNRPLSIPLNNQHLVSNREKTERDISPLQNNNASSINSTNIKCQAKNNLESVSCDTQQ